jgi:hypothetical protein
MGYRKTDSHISWSWLSPILNAQELYFSGEHTRLLLQWAAKKSL